MGWAGRIHRSSWGVLVCLSVIGALGLLLSGRLAQRTDEPLSLRVGVDPSLPPFAFVAGDGSLSGLEVDLVRSLAQALGLNLEMRAYAFDYLLQALEAGVIDAAVGALPCGDSLSSRVRYLPPHVSDGIALVRAKHGQPITCRGSGHVTAVPEGLFVPEELAAAKTMLVENERMAIQLLAAGEVKCALVSQLGACLARRDGISFDVEASAGEVHYCLAIRAGAGSLYRRALGYMSSAEGAQLVADLRRKWLGDAC